MLNNQWLWLDANVFNHENTLFLNQIKLLDVKIKRFKDYDSLAEELDNIEVSDFSGAKKMEINVICSSSLAD